MNRHQSTMDGTGLRRALATIVAGAVSFALSGCQDPVTGIFHHLANQQPTVDRSLANDITIGGVARWDDQYVATAGKLWSRPVGTAQEPGEWAQVTATYNDRDETAILMPLVRWQPSSPDEPSLVAGVLFVENDSFALLQATGSEIESDSIAWSSVSSAAVDGHEVIALFTPDVDESVLFVVLANERGSERSYTLLSATSRAAGDPDLTPQLEDLSHPIEAVASDGTGYWAVGGDKLYAGGLGNMAEWATSPSLSGSEKFRGVAHGGSDKLVLSGSEGTFWRSLDGGSTWPDPKEIQADDQNVFLTGVAAMGSTVLIATDSFGYYTADFEDESVDRLPITTEAIYQASIRSFWIDPVASGGTQSVFALTAGDGLWSTLMAPGDLPDGWQLE